MKKKTYPNICETCICTNISFTNAEKNYKYYKIAMHPQRKLAKETILHAFKI